MSERSSDKTPAKDTQFDPARVLQVHETTTDEGRESKTFTYQIAIGRYGVFLATSRRAMRDMPTPTDGNPNAMTPMEMEVISVSGGTEADDRRDYVRFSREFVPPLESESAREFVVNQLAAGAAGAVILTARELIEYAVDPANDHGVDAQPPLQET